MEQIATAVVAVIRAAPALPFLPPLTQSSFSARSVISSYALSELPVAIDQAVHRILFYLI